MTNRLRLDPDPYRAPDTDADPPQDDPMPRRSGCALGLVLGLVFWIVLLLAVRVGLDAISSASPTIASTPSRWTAEPAEIFRPLPAGSVLAETATPTPRKTPRATPRPPSLHGRFVVRGVATMTDTRCAAAGPALRRALGSSWRGTAVRVWYGDGAFRDTTLCDWCACRDRPGGPTVIDLPPWMFAAFGERPGVIPVRIELVR